MPLIVVPLVSQTRILLSGSSTSRSVSYAIRYRGKADLTLLSAFAGRAIRNARDWASIVLLDERYTQPSKKAQLPAWLDSGVQSPPTFGALVQDLARFNRKMRAAVS